MSPSIPAGHAFAAPRQTTHPTDTHTARAGDSASHLRCEIGGETSPERAQSPGYLAAPRTSSCILQLPSPRCSPPTGTQRHRAGRCGTASLWPGHLQSAVFVVMHLTASRQPGVPLPTSPRTRRHAARNLQAVLGFTASAVRSPRLELQCCLAAVPPLPLASRTPFFSQNAQLSTGSNPNQTKDDKRRTV